MVTKKHHHQSYRICKSSSSPISGQTTTTTTKKKNLYLWRIALNHHIPLTVYVRHVCGTWNGVSIVSIHGVRSFVGCLTRVQGELVDSVEHHVEASRDWVKQGHIDLKKAEVYQSKARKVFSHTIFFFYFCSILMISICHREISNLSHSIAEKLTATLHWSLSLNLTIIYCILLSLSLSLYLTYTYTLCQWK